MKDSLDCSILIPVGNHETGLPKLLNDLKTLYPQAEIICVGTDDSPSSLPSGVKWLKTEKGRARQMNEGVKEASHLFLWFLHADSQVQVENLEALKQALKTNPESLSYFDLSFIDGDFRLKINSWGTWVRSRIFGLPFGDQGFVLSKKIFWDLGGYDESAPYGEDHLLVWAAKKQGVPLNPLKVPLGTSARKYQMNGWLQTTLHHVFLTYLQAFKEIIRPKRSSKCAIAVFVKTPGLSPLKTRLAASLGKEKAEAFYQRSVRAVESVLKKAHNQTQTFEVFWAVAEKEGLNHSLWKSFSKTYQGEGDLGQRLHKVYSSLIKKYESVLLIGADCPEIELSQLKKAREILSEKNSKFVFGPALDGGFYLFGGSTSIPKHIWTDNPYSQETTLEKLREELCLLGEVNLLEPARDVDTFEDLKAMGSRSPSGLTAEQQELLDWTKRSAI